MLRSEQIQTSLVCSFKTSPILSVQKAQNRIKPKKCWTSSRKQTVFVGPCSAQLKKTKIFKRYSKPYSVPFFLSRRGKPTRTDEKQYIKANKQYQREESCIGKQISGSKREEEMLLIDM